MNLLKHLALPDRTGSFTVGVCPVLGDGTGARAAAAIARVVAQASPHRIVLVEATRKASQLASAFGVPRSAPGLREMTLPPPRNRFDTIHRTDLDNLYLLPSGEFSGTTTVAHVEWVHRILASHFPGIVMELPPMGEWLRRPMLKQKGEIHRVPDAVILVAASGRVGSWAVKRAVRRLKDADATLLGSFLT
jgi:hypothetical protein